MADRPQVAALSFDGVDDFLESGTATMPGRPLTLGAWFKTSEVTLVWPQIVTVRAATNNGWALRHRASAAFKRFAAEEFSTAFGGDAREAISGDNALDVWHSGVAIFTSATLRAAFSNGGSKGTNTDDFTIQATPDRIWVGRGPVNDYHKGWVAYVFVWDGALTDQEVADWHAGDPIESKLAAFYDFTVEPQSGIYPNLKNPGTFNLTVSGAVLDTEQTPPITYSLAPPEDDSETLRPNADIEVGNWSSPDLWPKISDEDNATYIEGVAG